MRSISLLRAPLCRESWAPRAHTLIRQYSSSQAWESQAAAVGSQLLRRGKERDPQQLPNYPARTRFAPSPTGYLHLGSLRTALFNYLLAKATKGQFILRVEDTDQTRIVGDAEERLYHDLHWAGLDWDEGPDIGGSYGPYRQSERLESYRQFANQLIESGHAYRCFCSPEDLERHKEQCISDGRQPLYPGTCTAISSEESAERAHNHEQHVVRFKCDHSPTYRDMVYGPYKKAQKEDHFILMKSDGYPTYHFANVVDDHLMDITHVVRGAEWLISTPKHIALYNAFGWEPPKFAHVGLLTDINKQKLSKRHGDIDIGSYQKRDVLPEALLNFAIMLGWSPKERVPDIMDMEEMVANFTPRFTKGDTIVNLDKLAYFEKHHVSRLLVKEGAQSPRIQKAVIQPLFTSVRKYDQLRLKEIEAENSTPEHKVVQSLGVLLPPLDASNHDLHSANNYISKLLSLEGRPFEDSDRFVIENPYLFWEIPRPVLQKEGGDMFQSVWLLAEGEIRSDPQKVTAALYNALDQVSEDQWTTAALETKLKPIIKTLKCSPINIPKDGPAGERPFGWRLLRWMINAGHHGPSLIHTMEILGREETLKRARMSMDMAGQLQCAAPPQEAST